MYIINFNTDSKVSYVVYTKFNLSKYLFYRERERKKIQLQEQINLCELKILVQLTLFLDFIIFQVSKFY